MIFDSNTSHQFRWEDECYTCRVCRILRSSSSLRTKKTDIMLGTAISRGTSPFQRWRSPSLEIMSSIIRKQLRYVPPVCMCGNVCGGRGRGIVKILSHMNSLRHSGPNCHHCCQTGMINLQIPAFFKEIHLYIPSSSPCIRVFTTS